MGYRLPGGRYANLYRFWGDSIADQLPATGRIVNLAANEYSKVVLTTWTPTRVVTPKFLTVDPKVRQAEVRRGAREDRAWRVRALAGHHPSEGLSRRPTRLH